MEPYLTVEAQAKELVALIDEPLRLITAFISQEEEMEKAARREQIKAYFYQHSAALGNLADIVFASPAFYETKWEISPLLSKPIRMLFRQNPADSG